MIEKALVALLESNAALAERVGARIYPAKRLPEGVTLPALTYFRVTTTEEGQNHDRSDGVAAPLFQIDVWTRGQGSALAGMEIAELVRRALNNFRGYVAGVDVQRIAFRNRFEAYSDETETTRQALDFRVWHGQVAA